MARQPRAVPAWVLLGSAHLARGNGARGAVGYRKVVALAPRDARGPHLAGPALRAQGKAAEARRSFEAALALRPGYVEPLGQLAAKALGDRQPEAALARVRQQLALEPRSAPLHALLGRVHLARRETDRAEAAFLKALELEPRLNEGHVELGRMYGSARKYDQALAKLNAGLAVNPQNVVTLMLVGVIHQQKGEVAQAQAAYEKILALNPRFAPAANNLAWFHSDHGGEPAKDQALALAQMAKQLARGVYQRALVLLREGAVRLPDNAELQYHLGMAAVRTGDRDVARKALAFAAASPAPFKGKDEARKTLAELN